MLNIDYRSCEWNYAREDECLFTGGYCRKGDCPILIMNSNINNLYEYADATKVNVESMMNNLQYLTSSIDSIKRDIQEEKKLLEDIKEHDKGNIYME